ncbi:Vesicle transport through interaction with t-SNAREs 1B [Portunus trituberculatus]|uniref:Vesicle transport through interaction with t-SNAREs 1B n=1 Tax=Portunus trituberculatus TaxID=210409 RepID=A0A5B7D2A1_PORTR|nr:Vesicle transport through interaction with t-SNAREs 1B [Portunus trituberculatus]
MFSYAHGIYRKLLHMERDGPSHRHFQNPLYTYHTMLQAGKVSKMSSHKFELLDEEVEGIMDQVTDKLQFGAPQCKSHEERRTLLSEVERLLKDANDSLVEMDIEVRKAPEDYRTTMNSKIHRYQNELIRHHRQLEQERLTLSHIGGGGRPPLFATDPSTIDAAIRKQEKCPPSVAPCLPPPLAWHKYHEEWLIQEQFSDDFPDSGAAPLYLQKIQCTAIRLRLSDSFDGSSSIQLI